MFRALRGRGLRGRAISSSSSPPRTPPTHEYYSFVTADWARKWPAEEIWVGAETRLTVSELDVVTGAFSYTGRYIAEELLGRGRRVRTLTRRPPDPSHPLAASVEAAPFVFDDSLVATSARRGHALQHVLGSLRARRGDFRRGRCEPATALRGGGASGRPARRARERREPEPGIAVPLLPRKGADRGRLAVGRRVARDRAADARLRPGTSSSTTSPGALRHVPVFLVPGDGQGRGAARVGPGHRVDLRRGGRARRRT